MQLSSSLSLSFILSLIFVAVVVVNGQVPTTFVSSDGYVYDLSSLISQNPISQIDDQNLWTYRIAICQNNIACDVCTGAGYCQSGVLGGKNYVYCIGMIDKGLSGIAGGKGVKLVYTESTGGRIGTVTINCVPGGALVANKKVISPQKVTDYEFIFDSSAACPTGSQATISGGSIFLILFFSIAALYVIGFVIYNFAVVKVAPGIELIPHLEFWKSVPGLVQDGVTFTIQKAKGAVGQ